MSLGASFGASPPSFLESFVSKTILYRAADEPNPDVWGRYVEAVTVDDGEVDALLAAGCVRHPQEIPEDARAAPAKAKKAADA